MTLVPSGEKRGSPPKSLSWRTWVPLAAAVKTVTSPYLPPSRINKILPRRFVARGAEGFELSGFELSGFELSELQLPATTMRAIDTTTVTITASRLLIAPPLPIFSLCCVRQDQSRSAGSFSREPVTLLAPHSLSNPLAFSSALLLFSFQKGAGLVSPALS